MLQKQLKAQWLGDCSENPFFCFFEKRLQRKAPTRDAHRYKAYSP
jgi:hypothetical protein